MTSWFRRVRGVVGVSLIWAAAWGFVGGLIELANNIVPDIPIASDVDMWIQMLAIPGALGGALFSTLLLIGDGRRRFTELSLPRMAIWGALGGMALGGIGMAFGLGRTAFADTWLRTIVVMTPLAALCSASAVATLSLARTAKDGTALTARKDVGRSKVMAGEPAERLRDPD